MWIQAITARFANGVRQKKTSKMVAEGGRNQFLSLHQVETLQQVYIRGMRQQKKENPLQ